MTGPEPTLSAGRKILSGWDSEIEVTFRLDHPAAVTEINEFLSQLREFTASRGVTELHITNPHNQRNQ